MYDTKELESKALSFIKEKKCIFIDDVINGIGIARQTFYNHKLDKLESIKELLNFNRTVLKIDLRQKWLNSNNATLQIALYKLLSTKDELAILNGTQTETTSLPNDIQINVVHRNLDELELNRLNGN